MTTAELTRLRELIDEHAGAEAPALEAAVDDLLGTIAGQALVVRNLSMELRNRRAGEAALEELAPVSALEAVLAGLGEPRPSGFTLAEAESASRRLVEAATRGQDLAAVLAAIARLVRVFTA
jgi:hypothetical protein